MKNKLLFNILFLTLSISYSQQNITVSNIDEYNKAIKSAIAGTNIILKNGIWKDVHLKAYGRGNKENPIVIKAEKAGQVIISGDSKLQIYGEYIIVQGLWFKDGKPTAKSIVSFRKNSTEYAKNCRFTHNTISYYNPEGDFDSELKSHWVDLWGKNNRVDHNNFTGKTNLGTTVVVWLKGTEHIENNHLIDANYFGPRPELGQNGGESIRIGTSKYSMNSSKTIVENNTFKNCDGEVEIISNKSADNIYRNNLFLASQGALTLRHGKNALVENNVFIGNSINDTGGIRIIDEGHIIRNNLMIGLKGSGSKSPITIMNGVPNSPLNRYFQVKNVNIQNNTLINCSPVQFAYGKDSERTLPPINTVFANNLITNIDESLILENSDDISGIKFINNIAETTTKVNESFFKTEVIDWKTLKNLPMPTSANTTLGSSYTDSKTPKKDITESKRDPFVVGAFNLDNTKYPKALTIRTGPYWQPKIEKPVDLSLNNINVNPGIGTLSKALKRAEDGAVLSLKEGIYYMTREEKIEKSITIVGSKNTVIEADKSSNPFKSFFKINAGINLTVKNINFNGAANNLKYGIISPSGDFTDKYSLYIDNCSFDSFKASKGSIFRSYANTEANIISINNSTFTNSYRGLNIYSKENIIGKVNADAVTINNSVFKNIDDYGVKYQGKSFNTGIASNLGKGVLNVNNSIFSNVNNQEKGKILQLNNIGSVNIKNSVFEKNFKAEICLQLKGNSKISNCVISNSGKVKLSQGAKQGKLFYKNPKWEDSKKFIPSKKSILLKENNKTETIGLLLP